jgi:O-methyltransferase
LGIDREPSFASDGLTTVHHSPFVADDEFNRLWDRVSEAWFGGPADIRWRVWLLTRCARHCRALPGSFVEFGVYRGGCSYMVLATAGLDHSRRLFLFDTFAGIPADRLTKAEYAAGLAGALADTSVDYVRGFLVEWADHLELVAGDIFDTLPRTEIGPVAFCHLDLNASQPTRLALEYLYPRLVAGGMLVMDDYGWAGYEDQREVLETFFAGKPEELIALPTGQALVVKLP